MEPMALLLLLLMLGLIFLSVPVPYAIGFSSIVVLLNTFRQTPLVLVQRTFSGLSGFTTLAIPLFILTAEIMNISGITDKLVQCCYAIVGGSGRHRPRECARQHDLRRDLRAPPPPIRRHRRHPHPRHDQEGLRPRLYGIAVTPPPPRWARSSRRASSRSSTPPPSASRWARSFWRGSPPA